MHQRLTNQGLSSFFLAHCSRWEARSNRPPVTQPASPLVIAVSIFHSPQEDLNRQASSGWLPLSHLSLKEHRYVGFPVTLFPVRLHDSAYVCDRPWPGRLLRCCLFHHQSFLYLLRGESVLG